MEVNRSEVANLFKSLSGGIFSLAKRWCYIMNMIRASHATMIIVKIRWAGLVVAFQGQDRDQAETRAFFVCSRWGGSVVDCWLLWLGFVSCLCSMTNTSEKYERTQQGNLLTCSQQMSPVIAFDIAVVAQKVKVQCWGPVWSEKVDGGGGSVIGRDGYKNSWRSK